MAEGEAARHEAEARGRVAEGEAARHEPEARGRVAEGETHARHTGVDDSDRATPAPEPGDDNGAAAPAGAARTTAAATTTAPAVTAPTTEPATAGRPGTTQ